MRISSKQLGELPEDLKRAVRAYETLANKTYGQVEFEDEWNRKYTIIKHSKPHEIEHEHRVVPDESC